MKVNFRSILMLVFLVVIVIISVSMLSNAQNTIEDVEYSRLIELFEQNKVSKFTVDGNQKMTITTTETDEKGNQKVYTYQMTYGFQLEEINSMALANHQKTGDDLVLKEYQYEAQAETPWYQLYLPYILFAVLLVVLFIFMMRQTSGGGKTGAFAKSHARVTMNDKNAVKFADVAGAEEEKAELEEVVDFLREPAKYVKLGARIPRGILLEGPPGTGKTLLAKAVAGEAGVPFFSISGSDFVEMYVGVGASRVRDLFDSARKFPAAIIFIDEIDAVGRHRGAGLGGGHDEREQTLNQLLVEMDGFGTSSGVIVMAATNRPDILDPALLRPGRFDRKITVNYPDIKGREAILRVHARNKPLEEGVDLQKIAQATIGCTGAELANLMNEAALLAAKKRKALIGMEDLEASYMKMLLGPQKKGKVRRPIDNKLCAYHEAGHAVSSYYCKHSDPVKVITIVPAGNAGGVTVSVPTEDKMGATKGEMIDRIIHGLGGRVAEELMMDDISTGASGDISQVTSIARAMVTRYGMSKLGTVLYGQEHDADEVFLGRDFSSGKNFSEKTAAEIDEEIRSIVADCYETCKKILTEHKDKLEFVAQFLLAHETMDDEQFAACMEAENPTDEEIVKIAEDRKAKSEEENKARREANAKREEELRKKEEEERRNNPAHHAPNNAPNDFFANFWNDMQNGTTEDESRGNTEEKPESKAEEKSAGQQDSSAESESTSSDDTDKQ